MSLGRCDVTYLEVEITVCRWWWFYLAWSWDGTWSPLVCYV